MIDHVSIEVTDLEQAAQFYELSLAAIGFSKLVEEQGTVGFGKQYPEFWLNHRPNKHKAPDDSGFHVCLRTASVESVNKFYDTAIRNGAITSGKPGFRPEYHDSYYAAFIKDTDLNHIEVVTFVDSGKSDG